MILFCVSEAEKKFKTAVEGGFNSSLWWLNSILAAKGGVNDLHIKKRVDGTKDNWVCY